MEKSNNFQNLFGLQIIMGPMFSGKSTELIRRIKLNNLIGRKTLVINSSNDIRCNNEVKTHDSNSVNAIKCDNLLMPFCYKINIMEYDVIAIDEAQFFDDLEIFVCFLLKKKKSIIVAGLNADCNQMKFGNIIDLIPKADQVDFLRGLCIKCSNGNPGCHTIRTVTSDTQMFIGAGESYKCVCRNCL